MTKEDKLKQRLQATAKDFTYQELERLLSRLGYEESKQGKTSGSRRAFIHTKTRHIIRLHKPHPGNELKKYQIQYLIEELKKEGLL